MSATSRPWYGEASKPADGTSELPVQKFLYHRAPLLVYWEATRACALACLHCRAEAVPNRHPHELSTEEARELFRQVATFAEEDRRPPHIVITGGDPLERPDIYDLIAYGTELGLSMSITPAGTEQLTPAVITRLKKAGMHSLGLSLDGSSAARHDTFRGVDGSFQWTVEAIRAAEALGIPMQINTMVTAQTVDDLPAIYEYLTDFGITRWALFFLISTGRGQVLSEITPEESERLLNWCWRRQAEAPFVIKTTEAHHFRRIAFLKMRRRGLTPQQVRRSPIGRAFGIRDGNGIVFVSHLGQVYPSGFLPHSAGSVRTQRLVDIYRDSALFRSIRDVNGFKGKCGQCEFRAICGGSRARAYAATGDPLQSDTLCPYQPRNIYEGR